MQWDAVSKEFDFSFLLDGLLLDGDKDILQCSEELFPFCPLFVEDRVVYLCVA